MVQLSKQQRVWLCLEFARVGNAAEVQRRWPMHFPQRPAPSLPAIRKNVTKLNNEATCHNLNKGRSGRRTTVFTQQNINRVRNSLRNNGKRSSRRNGLHLSATSFRRIVKKIKFHPYVMVRRQKTRRWGSCTTGCIL